MKDQITLDRKDAEDLAGALVVLQKHMGHMRLIRSQTEVLDEINFYFQDWNYFEDLLTEKLAGRIE